MKKRPDYYYKYMREKSERKRLERKIIEMYTIGLNAIAKALHQ